jgi:hypothetical protein
MLEIIVHKCSSYISFTLTFRVTWIYISIIPYFTIKRKHLVLGDVFNERKDMLCKGFTYYYYTLHYPIMQPTHALNVNVSNNVVAISNFFII